MALLKDLTEAIRSRWGWLVLSTIILIVVILIVLLGTLFGLHPWSDISADDIAGYGKEQCEKVTTGGFLLQQANFWSNFAYLFAGLLIWWRSRTFMGTFTGCMFCFLAFGSGFFHGTITGGGKYLDIMGIYAVLTTLVLQGILESFDLRPPSPVAEGLFFMAWLFGIFAGFFKNDISLFDSDVWTIILAFVLFILMGIGALICRARWKSFGWPAGVAVGAFALAVVFKFGDGKDNHNFPYSAFHGFLCKLFDTNSVIQGHALWHVSAAIGLYSVYEFFVSLRGKSNSVLPWRD